MRTEPLVVRRVRLPVPWPTVPLRCLWFMRPWTVSGRSHWTDPLVVDISTRPANPAGATTVALPEIEVTSAVTLGGADGENSTVERPLADSAVRREQSTSRPFTLPLELRKSISCARASRSSTDPLDELIRMWSA